MNENLVYEIATTLSTDWRLEEFPDDWVQITMEANFADFDSLADAVQPSLFDCSSFHNMLLNMWELLTKYEESCDSVELWKVLADAGVKVSNLTVLLFYAVELDLKEDEREITVNCMKIALAAGQLYLTICSINGSQAYHIFSSFFYQRVIICVSQAVTWLSQEAKGMSPTNKPKGRNKAKPNAGESSNLSGVTTAMSTGQSNEITESLDDFLNSLFVFLGKVGLDEYIEAKSETCFLLRSLMQLYGNDSKTRTDEIEKGRPEFSQLKLVSSKSFALMHRLIDRRHDRLKVGLTVYSQCILPRLLLFTFQSIPLSSACSIPILFVRHKDLALAFVRHRLQRCNEEEIQTMYTMVQNMCCRCPDRAEYLNKAVPVIVQTLLLLPAPFHMELIDFLSVLCQSGKTAYRTVAVEVCRQLIAALTEASAKTGQMRLSLMLSLVGKTSDKVAAVRARALTAIASLLSADPVFFCKPPILAQISLRLANDRNAENAENGGGPISDESEASVSKNNGSNDALINLISDRCCDHKVYVRKAAIQTVEALYPALSLKDQKQFMDFLKTRCTDSSVVVRKQTAECLNRLWEGYESEWTMQTWLDALLPLVTDRELSVQKCACNIVVESILKRLNDADELLEQRVWRLLGRVENAREPRRCIHKALIFLSTENMLNNNIVDVLEAKSYFLEKRNAAWMLLADLSTVLKVNPTAAVVRWYELSDSSDRVVSYLAKVLTCCKLSSDQRKELLDDVTEKLTTFRVCVGNISGVMNAAGSLFDAIGEEARGKPAMRCWCRSLLDNCLSLLSELVFTPDSTTPRLSTEEKAMRVLGTVGEAMQYFGDLIDDDLLRVVEAVVLNKRIAIEMKREGSGLVTGPVRARAVATLGQLCLQQEAAAKRCVPVLVRQLHLDKDKAVRGNILIVLADLCVRYTLLVDRYRGTIAECLKDESVLVRRQTLLLLTNLIKESFLKWKGQIMYHFVSTLLDKCQIICHSASFCLVNVLQCQFPDMFFHHFVECLFYFNAVQHPSWNALSADAMSALGDSATTCTKRLVFCGDTRSDDRMHLYRFMIKQFSDEKKLLLQSKLCDDVFSAVCSGRIQFDQDENVPVLVQDALMIMLCDEIKLSLTLGKKTEDDENVANVTTDGQVKETTKKILTNIYHKAMADHILPHVIALKQMLQGKRHPLIRQVMLLLKHLAKNHRNDLDAFLATHRQLKSEIEYDFRNLERQEADEAKKSQDKKEGVKVHNDRVADETKQAVMEQAPPANDVQDDVVAARRTVKEEPEEIKMETEDRELESNENAQPIPPRAISTPNATRLTDMTFALGKEFNVSHVEASNDIGRRRQRAVKRPADSKQ